MWTTSCYGTFLFIRSKQSKWGATWPLVLWCYWNWHQWPLAWCDANGIVYGTIAFVRLRQLKWVATWFFGHWILLALVLASCHTNAIINGTNVDVRWYNQHKVSHDVLIVWCYQQYVMLLASSMTPLHFLGHYNWNKVQHDFFSHMLPLVPAST